MLRSSRPFALELGVTAPLICYQGALIADPISGEWLLHQPMPVPLAREVIEACRRRQQHCNVYVDDELYVDELNLYALEYARHAKLEAHAVGDLARWLTEPTTKIVVVGEPELLDALQVELRGQFGERLFIAKSLPFFLEVAQPGVSKGSALHWVCAPPGHRSRPRCRLRRRCQRYRAAAGGRLRRRHRGRRSDAAAARRRDRGQGRPRTASPASWKPVSRLSQADDRRQADPLRHRSSAGGA